MDMPSISRARALAYAVVVLVALLAGARLLPHGDAASAGGGAGVTLEA
jgi:hypothetical protein